MPQLLVPSASCIEQAPSCCAFHARPSVSQTVLALANTLCAWTVLRLVDLPRMPCRPPLMCKDHQSQTPPPCARPPQTGPLWVWAATCMGRLSVPPRSRSCSLPWRLRASWFRRLALTLPLSLPQLVVPLEELQVCHLQLQLQVKAESCHP